MSGLSVLGIIAKLGELSVPSPSGKQKWSKATITNILTNEKYTGIGAVTMNGELHLVFNHHIAIISLQVFKDVQDIMAYRSNIVLSSDGKRTRSNTHYSSKK